MSLQHISTKTEFDDYVKKDAFILLKHSNTCPISAQAYDEFVKFVEDFPDFPAVCAEQTRTAGSKCWENTGQLPGKAKGIF